MITKLLSGILRTNEPVQTQHFPAANTAAIVTISANVVRLVGIHKIQWSYSADPTGCRLTISDATLGTIKDFDITKSGPGSISFTATRGSVDSIMTITLAAGGVGITGKLMVEYVMEHV